MAGQLVNRKQLIALIRRKGGKASKTMSNAQLVRAANKIGLGAKKASASTHKRLRKRKHIRRREVAHYAYDLEDGPPHTWDNPGPDPYRKDILVLDPGGISPAGPFGPFGDTEWMRKAHNPGGLPAPGQVVGMGDYMQMNPGMGDYLLNQEIMPYESHAGPIPNWASNPGMSDYLLVDETPAAPKKNPRGRWKHAGPGSKIKKGVAVRGAFTGDQIGEVRQVRGKKVLVRWYYAPAGSFDPEVREEWTEKQWLRAVKVGR